MTADQVDAAPTASTGATTATGCDDATVVAMTRSERAHRALELRRTNTPAEGRYVLALAEVLSLHSPSPEVSEPVCQHCWADDDGTVGIVAWPCTTAHFVLTAMETTDA